MTFVHFACDGCWVGLPAVIGFVVAVVVLIGSIYMLLWSNFGARQAYLITMVALAAWMILLSALWLFGAPGTTTGTGPRAREAAWVPFTPDSEVAKQDFAREIAEFPDGWDRLTADPTKSDKNIYPGKIDAHGEELNVITVIAHAEAALAAKQGTEATAPEDWVFRDATFKPATDDEKLLPAATVRFKQVGQHLLFGAIIPATAKHPQVTVFAYRDKGIVFLYALEFLLVSILLFVLHLILLARYETRKRREDEEPHSAAERESALV
jgi:hypothetical protein